MAHEDGLGIGDPREITVVGTDISRENWHFQVGANLASRVGGLMWFGPLRHLQRLFFHTPLVNLFSAASEAYHDYYRWPYRDAAVFEEWRRSTEWGKLFDSYASSES